MSSKTCRGDKFYHDGKPWVCLEVNKKQVLALRLSDLHTEILEKRAARARCGKQYKNLMNAVDDLVRHIGPGTNLTLPTGKVTVKKRCSSGDLVCEDEEGWPSRINKWTVVGSSARILLARSRPERVGQREALPKPLPSPPKLSDSEKPSPKAGRTLRDALSRTWHLIRHWARVLSLGAFTKSGKENPNESCNIRG